MKVSYQWLTDYIDLHDHTANQVADKIRDAGIEIDVVEDRNKGVNKVVVGYVESKEKHPDADKLNVCIVDAGLEEKLQIVCGAKNVDAGQKVPVALVGAVMPGGMEIKKAKLRGVASHGMICSAKELGLNDKLLPKELQEGILVLPQDTEIGTPIVDVLAINDHVLELDLTPNRSDCLSMLGVAYEVAAILGREVKLPQVQAEVSTNGEAAKDKVKVNITDKALCHHYTARYISGVKVSASPLWLQNRLMAAGVRPINNIVDITNYVMLEYGQPLHAFDADKLAGGQIDVRSARNGEVMVTLDDQERKLDPSMLLITDGEKPIAIAGVMGGANSEVTETTVNIVLESAKFDGGSVRKTSRHLGLRSEASIRFEKEVNPEAVIPAINRAAELMAALAGGAVAQGIVQAIVTEPQATVVKLSLAKVNRYLGTTLATDEIKAIFDRLQFAYDDQGESVLVTVPKRRGDITQDVDLIEEIARLYGYENIPTTLIEGSTTPGGFTKSQRIRRELRQLLTDNGIHEVISYSFTHPSQTEIFGSLTDGLRPVPLAMPMSEERSVLRTSIVPNLLDIATYNRNRKTDDVAIFEIANIYATQESELTTLPQEQPMLALLLTGHAQSAQWNQKPVAYDFYDLKGVLETVFTSLGVAEQIRFVADQPKGYHPGRSASIYLAAEAGDVLLGTIGQIHPELQREKDLGDTYVAELRLAPLYDAADFAITYKTLPRFPAVQRDIAVVVASDVPVGQLVEAAKEEAADLLEAIQVFDVFVGEKLGLDKKSVAISLVYRHAERTLTDEEVTEAHGKVVARLEQSFHAELRK
ncbi:phenylalanine--tRNA ligase subunit beta [Paenibacillus selenitireducens]|uniref:Phenylalanine--tRNA ligase beta subunit n=1 Tax=Paenibacillus selenitireducens TaxID=1324314 RepID=A0A1T2XAF7_9BACL|nr:phenylalanine--tRNA ligase subunit beta [Paenibacillus selenitireducens]OPA76792.1 phenylalanine--tRNA ligase subunit beta [Paenibacillus selenitireducens]